jgi:hypothetical protein
MIGFHHLHVGVEHREMNDAEIGLVRAADRRRDSGERVAAPQPSLHAELTGLRTAVPEAPKEEREARSPDGVARGRPPAEADKRPPKATSPSAETTPTLTTTTTTTLA